MPSDKGKTPRSKTPRSTSSKAKSKDAKSKAPPPKQQKTKRPETANKIPEKGVVKKKKSYSAEELGIPKLNGIIPAGVIKPKGKKKAKVFVDDQERMMMILAVVNAEAEGKVESKMMRQRQLEEVREARKLETERRESEKKGALEDVKDQVRRKRSRKGKAAADRGVENNEPANRPAQKTGKRVSFAT